MKNDKRLSGILLHPTSFPSPYGIGDLGEVAYEFVDFLAESGQHLWQILPLTPTGYGDSPYQSFSAFAGQPLLIAPSHLLKLGLITEADLTDCPVSDPEHIDYGSVIPWKQQLFRIAYEHFTDGTFHDEQFLSDFKQFIEEQNEWLNDYALFMACKDVHNGACWLDWAEEYRIPTEEFRQQLRSTLHHQIQYYQFLQFLFFE